MRIKVKKAAAVTAAASAMLLTVLPAKATGPAFQYFEHAAQCMSLMLSDPDAHASECGTNDFGSGAGGSNYQDSRNVAPALTYWECRARKWYWEEAGNKCTEFPPEK